MSGLRLTEEQAQQVVKATVSTVSPVEKMRELLNSNEGDGTVDMVWGPVEDIVLGTSAPDPFGSLEIDNDVIGMLVDSGINNETELRDAVASGRDLTKIKGIGQVTEGKILDALGEPDA